MTSVERIIEYTQLQSEHSLKRVKKSPLDWPNKGQIIYKNVSLKYDPNLPEVLRDISLNISPGQKIGFVLIFNNYFIDYILRFNLKNCWTYWRW